MESGLRAALTPSCLALLLGAVRAGSGMRLEVEGKFFRRGDQRWLIKGVSYGPFDRPLESSDAVRRDLARIKEWHFNALRLHEAPRLSFFELCREIGLDVFVTIPWDKDSDFLRGDAPEKIIDRCLALVRDMKEAKSLEGYFVCNEVPADLVRWMGPTEVGSFLEELISAVCTEDPTRLVAYANYPSTEYLQPRNADFHALNIYLEDRARYRAYLRRLHHLAGDRPLVISEYGLDSLRHGEEKQAETLGWLTEETFLRGAAGSFAFAYTDDWFNGGQQVEDWAFGLTRRDRSEKPSAAAVRGALSRITPPGIQLKEEPKATIIVCTHNGHNTLTACLESIGRLRYENFETLVVDDGSKPGIERIVQGFPKMRYLRQEHAGLSAARNLGAREATGDYLVFTDDDCEVDRDWLTMLMSCFLEENCDACGGPNLPPPSKSLTTQCIAIAPGNPTQVMIDDFQAEHLPGCNLAVTKKAWEALGGFRRRYWVAGDDVDFSWRLREAGRSLGFAPNAFVWHHRRKNLWAFCRQQMGYGRAEALLAVDHPQRFSGVGGARWTGAVYMAGVSNHPRKSLIYHGHFGRAAFQQLACADEERDMWWTRSPRSLPWAAWTIVFIALAFAHPVLWIPALAMLGLSLVVAVLDARKVYLPKHLAKPRAWVMLTFLHWIPPLARAFVRWMGSPPMVSSLPMMRRECAFWNHEGVEREAILERLEQAVGQDSTLATPWGPWDLVLPNGWGTYMRLVSATERHLQKSRTNRLAVSAYLRPRVRLLGYALSMLLLFLLLRREWLASVILVLAMTAGVWGLLLDTRKRMGRWVEKISEQAKALGMLPQTQASPASESQGAAQ